MRPLAKNAARPWGFTLVELLTVIAIIAVLATLLTATLSNAQRKGRKAVSTSNLRQIAVAFNLYSDDHGKRPVTFRQMVQSKYLSDRVILCPEDRLVKNWAGLLEGFDTARLPGSVAAGPDVSMPGAGRDDVNEVILNPICRILISNRSITRTLSGRTSIEAPSAVLLPASSTGLVVKAKMPHLRSAPTRDWSCAP